MRTRIFKKIKSFYQKYAPKEHQLKNTLLHRIFGEKIFDPVLWTPSKKGIIVSFTMGTFVAFTPTISGQMAIAGCLAFFLRSNIPVAMLMVWITNPLTMFFIYSFEIKLGQVILGNPAVFHKIQNTQDLLAYILPLTIGSLITSTVMSICAYILINILVKIAGQLVELNPIHIPHIHVKKKTSDDDNELEEENNN